ncbi:alpha/beta hydrolase [Legionella sp. D16C41]|uniref:alpha/beta hydrolase n=1 Tax=Legionella sp. D16C41 TaxID=3402688 RepID=UPI003AF5294E
MLIILKDTVHKNYKIMRQFSVLIISIVLVLSSGVSLANTWQPSLGHKQIPIWPNGKMPNPVSDISPEHVKLITDRPIAGKTWKAIYNVSQPTMTVYSPREKNTGIAIVVFPGGGFNGLAIDLEGTEVCTRLTSQGITCVLLKYRVPDSGPAWHDSCQCNIHPIAPTALQDAQRTVGLVRKNAVQWHINPNKIGVLGFSAGGYMVADISTHFKKRAYKPIDIADRVSCRPDFAIALYPGHLWTNEKKFELDPDITVTSLTPPTFLIQAEDDQVDSIHHSLVYYTALKKAKVPVEMHLYAQGGHGFGVRTTNLPITNWPHLVEIWLKTIGMISK